MPDSGNEPAMAGGAVIIRARLLAAACEEFCETSFHDTDTTRITARARLSPGTFHCHFKDKTEIFAEAFEFLHREEVGEITARIESASAAGASAGEIVDAIFAHLLDSRRRQTLIRLQCAILRRSERRIWDAERRARSDYVVELTRAFNKCPTISAGPGDHGLNVYILDALVNAIANEDFEEHHLTGVVAEIKAIISGYFKDG